MNSIFVHPATIILGVMWVLVAGTCGWSAETPAAAPNQWVKTAAAGKTGNRLGASLVWQADKKRVLLLGGELEGLGAYVQAFDPVTGAWSDLPGKNPGGRFPTCNAAYDAASKTIYFLHGDANSIPLRENDVTLMAYDAETNGWRNVPTDPQMKKMAYMMIVFDPEVKQLVVIGADQDTGNLGWMKVMAYDVASGQWSRVDCGTEADRQAHETRQLALQAIRDLVGRTRNAWYKDPAGTGTAAERADLSILSATLAKMQGMKSFTAALDGYVAQIKDSQLLDALKSLRALQRSFEDDMEARAPVPCARRESPLAYDEANKVVVMFGGDHEDYLLNDTWVFDVARKIWQRAAPKLAPPARFGHVLTYLPVSKSIALYGGLVQATETHYACAATKELPRDLWVYNVKSAAWTLVKSWPDVAQHSPDFPPCTGSFQGWSCNYFAAMPTVANDADVLILAPQSGGATWTLTVDAGKADTANVDTLGQKPNTRQYRAGIFLAEYSEVSDQPKDAGLDKLPTNQWVRLPAPPRTSFTGCRAKDWGTAAWDPDHDQILYWGGGHCVRAASSPTHWSPASNRFVDPYDADENYCGNGGGPYGGSLLGRSWIPGHAYRLYTYDPKAKLLVTAYGTMYDPVTMDWVRQTPAKSPHNMDTYTCILQGTPHGAVLWATANNGKNGLWLFDRQTGWTDLEPKADVGGRYCDTTGMAYDSKRDRLMFGSGRGNDAAYLAAFDFATKELEKLAPANGAQLGKIGNSREMTYVAHADWVIFGEPYMTTTEPKKQFTRFYDIAKNRYLLLDAGTVEFGHSSPILYDGQRKLVYVINCAGTMSALRLDTTTATMIETAP